MESFSCNSIASTNMPRFVHDTFKACKYEFMNLCDFTEFSMITLSNVCETFVKSHKFMNLCDFTKVSQTLDNVIIENSVKSHKFMNSYLQALNVSWTNLGIFVLAMLLQEKDSMKE